MEPVLLSFTVRNFRSFADEVELSLASAALKTTVPRKGQTWIDTTERVAAVYGPNAAGKTTLLDAMYALSTAVRTPGDRSIYQPSHSRHSDKPTTDYEVEFVAEEVLFRYSVSVASWGIARETLTSYPKSAPRVLFMREQDSPDAEMTFVKGKSLTGPTAEVKRITTGKMLFLATAHRYGHSALAPIARALVAGIGIEHISFRERHDEEVLKRVMMEMIAGSETQIDLVKALVKSADLGVERIEVREEKIPAKVQERVRRIMQALTDGDEGMPDDAVPQLRDAIVFVHRAEGGEEFELSVKQQSAGTIVWLTTAWHALDALRKGAVLLVDELDASLHPELVRYIVELFLNPQLNSRGAQLIFTTHDVSLLGNAPTRLLEPRNVWFVGKNDCGVAELYSLDDFDNRKGNNSERRYMAGQFGAVPDIDDSLLVTFIAEQEGSRK